MWRALCRAPGWMAMVESGAEFRVLGLVSRDGAKVAKGLGREDRINRMYRIRKETRVVTKRSSVHHRGRDDGFNVTPPSKPDGPISRIRLSGWWGLLCGGGACLPRSPKMSFRRLVTAKPIALGCFHHRLALAGTRVGLSSIFRTFIFPPSCVPFAPRSLLVSSLLRTL